MNVTPRAKPRFHYLISTLTEIHRSHFLVIQEIRRALLRANSSKSGLESSDNFVHRLTVFQRLRAPLDVPMTLSK